MSYFNQFCFKDCEATAFLFDKMVFQNRSEETCKKDGIQVSY